MSLSSAVAAAWETHVFGSADIRNITDKALPYELFDRSEYDISIVSFAQELNFFEYVITRSVNYPDIGGAAHPEFIFQVEVRYTREIGESQANHERARDALDTFQSVVQDDLGPTWDDTVRFWVPQPIQSITQRSIADTPCWSWVARYAGTYR